MFTGCDDNYGGWLGCCNGGDAFCKVRIERVDSRNYDGRVFGSQCRVTGDRCGAVDPDADHVYHKSNVAEREQEYEKKCVFFEGDKIIDRCNQLWFDRNAITDGKECLKAIESV